MLRPLGLALSLSLLAGAALAADPPAKDVVAPAGGGQSSLHAVVVGSELHFQACASAPCAPSAGGGAVRLPSGADVSLRALAIGGGRHVVWAHADGFDAIVATVPGAAGEAKVLFEGATGATKGEEGERSGAVVQVEPAANAGEAHVLLGETREDVTICGRQAILSPKLLDPRDLAWKGATVQRLSQEERGRATAIAATLHEGDEPTTPARVLRASAASSAVGGPAALTDGDPETTWAEGRGGDGHGEFVQMNAASDVPIRSLSIVVRPAKRAVPKGAAPTRLWLATTDRLFAVTLPDDAWSHPGASYDVAFDAPLETSCMALVLDQSASRGKKDVEVTLAEVTAHTDFDGAADPSALVGALAGGSARSRAARSLLQRGGEPSFVATAAGYDKLDDVGRSLALEVLDNAPCKLSAPVYLHAAVTGFPGERHHARDRMRRCGADAALVLEEALAKGSDPTRIVAAEELSLVAPDRAIAAILEALPKGNGKTRVELRTSLAHAARSDRGLAVLRARLADERMPASTMVDLLRATPDRPELRADVSAAFARTDVPSADFRTRYLLLETAAHLAAADDARATPLLRAAIGLDPDHHVRARAAEVAAKVPALAPELVRALGDAEPRVRDAALTALAEQAKAAEGHVVEAPGETATIAARLGDDPWTFVRGHAADALGAMQASEAADRALATALGDPVPLVRARSLEALGAHRALAQAPAVRDRLDDDEETIDVRARAARALGRMCDARSIGRLTKLAKRGAEPFAPAEAQLLAAAAAAALGRLHPADLSSRLAPLVGEGSPRMVAAAAKAALEQHDVCTR